MKKIYTTLFTLLIGVAVFAADMRFTGKLTIRSLDNDDIKVMVDGKRFDPAFNSLKLENLRPGMHKIKVYKEKDRFFRGFGRNRYELVYNATVHVRPGTHILVTIDRFNRSKVETRTVFNKGRGFDHDRNRRINDWDDNDRYYDFERDGKQGRHDDEWEETPRRNRF